MTANAEQPLLAFAANCPRGLGDLLARELGALGAEDLRERGTSVQFRGALETAYRACLESRLANRVLLEIASFTARDAQQLYEGARALDWREHIGPQATIACEFSGRHPTITHSHFAALKLKDAICDQLRERTGSRPDVVRDRPSVRIHAHAQRETITLSIDLAGESLHRRRYRTGAGAAPLKENVAAGMLLRAGWQELAAKGAAFLDPMCGSGTLVIEAAMIAADIAPALGRDYFGFLGWRGHNAALWERLRLEAQQRIRSELPTGGAIRGLDQDPAIIRTARENAQQAGVATLVQFEALPLAQAAPAEGSVPGLVAANPPYGVRMQDPDRARALYRELGEVLRERFQGWDAVILTGAPELGRELGIRAHRTHTLWNGAIECRLLRMKIEAASEREPGRFARSESSVRDSAGAAMFANRLAKNFKRRASWAKRENIHAYRLYDADMPEYAFAIDLYQTLEPEQSWLYVQEYAAPADIELEAVQRRRREALSTLTDVTGVPREQIRLRLRRRHKRGEQYAKLGEESRFHLVEEGGLRFEVNFDDYLDTGLFLDHRLTRAYLRSIATGVRFLNLFAYTGTASVYAAAGGARSTTSVDLSRTYLDWTQRNLRRNGFDDAKHQLVQADCREWLAQAGRASDRYDLVFLDPPTFSNSKRMEGVLDIERDHAALIDACMAVLESAGVLVFSTNARRFKLDAALASRYRVRELSARLLPQDYERDPRIHHCFELSRAGP